MMLEQLDIDVQEINLDPYFIPHTKINSKWIINLNVKSKTVKFLEENMKQSLKWVREICHRI